MWAKVHLNTENVMRSPLALIAGTLLLCAALGAAYSVPSCTEPIKDKPGEVLGHPIDPRQITGPSFDDAIRGMGDTPENASEDVN
jgi:hypothetical protein